MRASLLCLLFCLSACAQDSDTEAQSASSTAKTPPPPQKTDKTKSEYEMISVQGTIVYKTLEGGFWALDAEDGRKFMPHGLPDNAMRPGLVVKVEGKIIDDMLTIQQYGQVLKVRSVVIIDDSKVSKPDAF